jgi:hypothetical protein
MQQGYGIYNEELKGLTGKNVYLKFLNMEDNVQLKMD